jgi:hypothetical protein
MIKPISYRVYHNVRQNINKKNPHDCLTIRIAFFMNMLFVKKLIGDFNIGNLVVCDWFAGDGLGREHTRSPKMWWEGKTYEAP